MTPEHTLYLKTLLASSLLLYAETHYKFKGIYSRLKKSEPEIIADVPHRLEPGHRLPVLILIKDAHLYPIELLNIEIRISKGKIIKQLEEAFNETISDPLWTKVLQVTLPEEANGAILVDVIITIQVNGKTRQYHNDNYRISSHQPYRLIVDNEPLPATPHWYFGDMHYHSAFTSDQVEFGAPLDATVQMARAMGLHFFAVTDHSYDLDDRIDDYLTNDPNIPKWHRLWQECQGINEREKDFVVLPGEELSAGNRKNENVHLLILNNREFFAGSGDSAERWLRTKPEHQIHDVLNALSNQALAFAAHPEIVPPLLQKLLIRRGKWQQTDYDHPGLNGLQIWNGRKDVFFECGIKKWVELLLEGRNISIVAGNDAHGNFARFRQIGLPFFTLRENDRDEIFARARTGVFIKDEFTYNNLIEALKKGRIIVTDGPFADISLSDGNGRQFFPGEVCNSSKVTLDVRVVSSKHFGAMKEIDLFIGDIEQKKETRKPIPVVPSGSYNLSTRINLEQLPHHGYIRLEVTSSTQVETFRCLTNAIYIR